MRLVFESPPEHKKRRYLLDGMEVPSVTTILQVLQKGSLPWWGMTVGVEGMRTLIMDQVLLGDEGTEEIVRLLTEHKLTVNHVRDKAATRGTGVHKALEMWMREKRIPRPSEFPEEERGYVVGLAKALLALNPVPQKMEVMVASETHGYAGTFDLLCVIDGKRTLLDLKTSKRVYEEAFLQLEAYELAHFEMGEAPTEQRMVLRVDKSGEYETALSYATGDQFLRVKGAYDAMQELKASKPKKGRVAA